MQSLVNILETYYKKKSKESGTNATDPGANASASTTSADNDDVVKKLYTIHRLDRLTSGLVILGKTSSVARSYSKCIMDRSCQKIYLARVAGKFPLNHRAATNTKLGSKRCLRSGVPLNGEWNEEVVVASGDDNDKGGDDDDSTRNKQQLNSSCSNEQKKDLSSKSNPVSRLRKKYALACWIEDEQGTPIFEYDDDNANGHDSRATGSNMLEQVFRCRHRYVIL